MRAWRPEVPGVVEVLHARMTSHVYPMHTHESWTLLIVDDGMVRYDLHRREHGALGRAVTLLPPQVPHNGRAATAAGFSKRVVYLDLSHLPGRLIGRAVGQPVLADPLLRQRIRQLHDVLGQAGRGVRGGAPAGVHRGTPRLAPAQPRRAGGGAAGAGVADGLRDLIDARFREKMTLRDAADVLHAHPAHLVRAFGSEFGISPHQYLTSRRVDLARRLLLDGMPPSLAAAEAGFYDQSHLTRHFRHVLGTSPGRYAKSGGDPGEPGGCGSPGPPSCMVWLVGVDLELGDLRRALDVVVADVQADVVHRGGWDGDVDDVVARRVVRR